MLLFYCLGFFFNCEYTLLLVESLEKEALNKPPTLTVLLISVNIRG